MRTFVKSLHRLYPNRVSLEKINSYKESEKITEEEYQYIISK